MNILILGGTGAMGVPLVKFLAEKNDNNIYVTTRSKRDNKGNVTYIQGNAREEGFFLSLMEKTYDVIVDFMVYSIDQFEKKIACFSR